MPSATENNGKNSGMDEAHLLLPWYVAGTLDEAEAREIETLAKEDPEFAELVAAAKRESEATASVNEALGKPSADLWSRIEKSAEQERRAQSSQRLSSQVQSLRSVISGFFARLTAPQWQAVAAAAMAVCVIQAGAIIYLAGAGQSPTKFHTASGAKMETGANRSVFIVSFSGSASMDEIGKALDEAGAVIVDGPDADMLYRLGLRNDTVEAKDRAYAKLQSSGVAKLILPEK